MNQIRLRDCRELIDNSGNQNLNSHEMNLMLDSLQSKNIYQLAKEISQYISNSSMIHNYLLHRSTLVNIAKDFHKKAGTFTPEVNYNISKLERNEPILLIPHQPNLFPSLSVITPFILLEKVANVLSTKNNISTALIYFIIDYDSVDDRRFRTSRFPDIFHRDGLLLLNYPIEKSKRHIPMWLLEKPPKTLVNKWIEYIYQTIINTLISIKSSNIFDRTDFSRYYNFILSNFHIIESIIWKSYESSRSFTEFNSIFLSKLINNYWGQEICFIPGHLVHSNNSKAFEWVIHKSSEIRKLEKEASSIIFKNGYKTFSALRNEEDTLLWYVCDKCNKRVTLKISSINKILSEHVCSVSLKKEIISIPINQLSFFSNRIYPKVLFDNILDTIALGKVGGSGYIGQAEHLVVSNYIAKKLKLPTPPQIILINKGLHYGLVELSTLSYKKIKKTKKIYMAFHNSYFGKASILYYLICIGIAEIKKTLDIFFLETENVYNANEYNNSVSSFSQLINKNIKNLSDEILHWQENFACLEDDGNASRDQDP